MNKHQTRFKSSSPTPIQTKISYMVSAAGKYRLKVFMSQPSAPNTEVEIRSSRFMTWVASHSTMPSKIPMRGLRYGLPGVQVPPLKNGVM